MTTLAKRSITVNIFCELLFPLSHSLALCVTQSSLSISVDSGSAFDSNRCRTRGSGRGRGSSPSPLATPSPSFSLTVDSVSADRTRGGGRGRGSSPSPSEVSRPSSRNSSPSSLSKKRAGNALPIRHDKWNDEMKNTILDLLAKYSEQPNKHSKVFTEYNRMMLTSQMENGAQNKLWSTCSRQIQFFDRNLNRELESAYALSTSSSNIPELASDLQQSSSIPSSSPPAPPTPALPSESASSIIDVENLSSSLSVEPKPEPEPVKQPRKNTKHEFSGSNSVGRNCLVCGGPKRKTVGENNLHDTIKKPGQPCLFYCPVKMNRLYGSPVDMTSAEFKQSDFFQTALDDVAAAKQAKLDKKERLKREREAKGVKTPGPKTKKEKVESIEDQE